MLIRQLLILVLFPFKLISSYDPTYSDIKMIYIHGETKHSHKDAAKYAFDMYLSLNDAKNHKKPEKYFARVYIRLHSYALYREYHKSLFKRIMLKRKCRDYKALQKKALILFQEIKRFQLKADLGPDHRCTALLQAAGIPLVDGPDIEVGGDYEDFAYSTSSDLYGCYSEEYDWNDDDF